MGRSDKRMDQQSIVSRFYSHDAMWAAREAFLVAHEEAMKLRVQQIQAGSTKLNYSASITMSYGVSEGLICPPANKEDRLATAADGAEHISNIRTVVFRYQYVDSCWYKLTGFPNARREADARKASGPVIQL